MMKYALNHPYRFSSYWLAFFAGLLQVVSSVGIELCNLLVICCVGDALGIVSNFVALVIVAEFDNHVYQSMKVESFRVLIDKAFTEKAFVICHTTSIKCADFEMTDFKDSNGNLRPIKVNFKDRTCLNKFCFMTYRIVRSIYISVYFYFLPFLLVMISTFVPYIYFIFEIESKCPPSS